MDHSRNARHSLTFRIAIAIAALALCGGCLSVRAFGGWVDERCRDRFEVRDDTSAFAWICGNEVIYAATERVTACHAASLDGMTISEITVTTEISVLEDQMWRLSCTDCQDSVSSKSLLVFRPCEAVRPREGFVTNASAETVLSLFPKSFLAAKQAAQGAPFENGQGAFLTRAELQHLTKVDLVDQGQMWQIALRICDSEQSRACEGLEVAFPLEPKRREDVYITWLIYD